MNVIFHSANGDGLAIVIRQDAAHVAVQFIAQGFAAENRATVFGREYGVNQNLGEGLQHDVMVTDVAI